MFGIGRFFERIKSSQAREYLFRKTIAEIINKEASVLVSIGQISSKGGVVLIVKISQAAKSAIFIKKQKILQQINDAQDTNKIIDIRF